MTHWLLVWIWVCTALLGSEISYHDCSSFTDEQLSGVDRQVPLLSLLNCCAVPFRLNMDAPLGRLIGLVCTDYPKAMSCSITPEPEPEYEPHGPVGPYNPDHNGYNTGLATRDDPLIADFRHAMWLYKFGLFVFMASSLAAILSTEPELPAARPKRFELSAGAGRWSSAHVVLGVFSVLGALLVGIGAHGMFALDADDILYGDGKGGPAPLGPLSDCKPLPRAEPMHLTCSPDLSVT